MNSMGSNLVPIFAFLLLAVVVSHAALPSEVYWDKVLPNTPMPKAVRELLLPADLEEDKSTAVNVGKGGVVVDSSKPGKSGTHVNVGKGGVAVNTGKPASGTHVNVGKGGVAVNTGKPGSGTHVNVGKGGVGVNTGKPGGKGTSVSVGGKGGVNVNTKGKHGGGTRVNVGGRKGGVGVSTGGHGSNTRVGVGKGGVNVHTGTKKKPVTVSVHPGRNPFSYNYAASEDQLHADPNVALFFLEKDLLPGTKMNLHFTKTTKGANFLPHQVAKAIPFSSEKLPEVMEQFSVNPQSIEAEAMKQTIKECEEHAQEGEEKSCATSLESMVDFTTSKLGKQVQPMSTEVDKDDTPKQQYSIVKGVKKIGGENSVVCHSQTYAYAVFYCHETHSTKAYKVPLVGSDGTKVTAVAVCHTDTAKWNPKHLAFQVLKVKPGTVPVCHFLPEDHIVWISN
ncbi:hypothetical protein AQUCO_00100486v1 [Aquilegia coerulea]|uniref:BURP domain-containing protein n=1 Tax=Aquilegia coerulea TaxID=218851 RepID=A0A2G5FAL3_AQUCA|nr:hypothetical protein AQUCO_00100486v1 [Aquilegia coerulea]